MIREIIKDGAALVALIAFIVVAMTWADIAVAFLHSHH